MRIQGQRYLVLWFLTGCCLSLASSSAAGQTFTYSPKKLQFGDVTIGTYSTNLTVTVTNTSPAPLTINSYSITPSQFYLDYGYAPVTIEVNHTFQFSIWFVPTSTATVSGQLTLNIGGTDAVVLLRGKGITTGAVASLSTNALSFNNVLVGTTSPPQPVTVTNTGTYNLTVESVHADAPFVVTGFTSPVVLSPQQNLPLQVTFTGTMPQYFANVLTLTYDVLPGNGVSLSATAVPATSMVVSTFPTLPSGVVEYPYLATLQATSGTPPYTWSVVAGSSLPAGLSLSSSGTITGTLASSVGVGSYSFQVSATDSSSPAQNASAPLTLPVAAPTSSNCNNIVFDIAKTTNPLIDLPDLGTGTYFGYEGGLYPNGSNQRPAVQDAAGQAIANAIQPLDADGNPDPKGKYALLSVGMSASADAFNLFQSYAAADSATNPHLAFVLGAQPRAEADQFANPESGTWTAIFESFLPQAGVTANQVVAAWIADVDSDPTGKFPDDMATLQSELESIVQNLHMYFPNLQLAYFDTRIYAGYSVGIKAVKPQDPEPYGYESGFATKWAIQDQLNGNADLNYNPLVGPVMAPWMSWSSYDWANGLLARQDGLVWACPDLKWDGTHPSDPIGRQKEANLILNFFRTDDTTAPWYLAPQ